jgi:hypothetical protein
MLGINNFVVFYKAVKEVERLESIEGIFILEIIILAGNFLRTSCFFLIRILQIF